MFNIGFSELILLLGLALIIIGPKQLPEVAAVIGRFLNELRRAADDLTGSFVESKRKAQDDIDEVSKNFKSLPKTEPLHPGKKPEAEVATLEKGETHES